LKTTLEILKEQGIDPNWMRKECEQSNKAMKGLMEDVLDKDKIPVGAGDRVGKKV